MGAETGATFAQWAHLLLEWIGFGTLVGLLAKAIMPGRDPGGPLATILMGVGGCIFGLGTMSYFYEGQRITPISVIGFFVATAGAFAILCFYRMLAGYFFIEGEGGRFRYHWHSRRRRNSSVVVVKD